MPCVARSRYGAEFRGFVPYIILRVATLNFFVAGDGDVQDFIEGAYSSQRI